MKVDSVSFPYSSDTNGEGPGNGIEALTYMKERHENGQSQQPQVCVQKNSL